jgi:hypothetical protein
VTAKARALGVVAVTAVVAAYLVVRAVDLFRTGSAKGALLGVGVLLLVLVGGLLVTGEVRLAAQSQRLGQRLFAEGFVEEDLPTTSSGRVDRDAADALFAKRKAEVEANPEDWRAWFVLATAYDAARDSQRGRRAMRKAVALERLSRS